DRRCGLPRRDLRQPPGLAVVLDPRERQTLRPNLVAAGRDVGLDAPGGRFYFGIVERRVGVADDNLVRGLFVLAVELAGQADDMLFGDGDGRLDVFDRLNGEAAC